MSSVDGMTVPPHVFSERPDIVYAAPDARVRTTYRNGWCHGVLDHPSALNALDLDLARGVRYTLETAAQDPHTCAVVMTSSSSPRSFCAGGNITAALTSYEEGRGEDAENFFAVEYDMMARIADYPLPYVTLVDGYCIGGGLGISATGGIMVVTENARMRMPEASLGFCTDAGMSWVLGRLWGAEGQVDPAVGRYIALTGHWLSAADAIWSGLASYYVPSQELPDLLEGLLECANPTHQDIVDYLSSRAQHPGPSFLEEHIQEIDEVFSATSIQEIDRRLEVGLRSRAYGEWAQTTLEALHQVEEEPLEGTLQVLLHGEHAPTLSQAIYYEWEQGARRLCYKEAFARGVRRALGPSRHSENGKQKE